MKVGTYKNVLYGVEENKFYILEQVGSNLQKVFFDDEAELKEYIDINKEHFI